MFHPLRDFIVIRPLKEETAGKIIIPETVQSRANIAEVVETGSGRDTPTGRVAPEVMVGDIVLFMNTQSHVLPASERGGEDLYVIRETDTIARQPIEEAVTEAVSEETDPVQ